jgi:hypothetical protein
MGKPPQPPTPQEDPPIQPGRPTEPPQEQPPGNPQPDIPPPMQEPDMPQQPQELPGITPNEAPLRGPEGPRTPNPATDTVNFNNSDDRRVVD